MNLQWKPKYDKLFEYLPEGLQIIPNADQAVYLKS